MRDRALPEELRWETGNSVDGTYWLSKSDCDALHLNWHSGYTADFKYIENRNPLPYLVWAAQNCFHGPTSISFGYLEDQLPLWEEYELDSSIITPLRDEVLRHLATLNQVPIWLVVERAVVIHATRRDVAATALFELLGDEVVRIVDATETSNQEDIAALYALAEAGERKAAMPRQNCLCTTSQRATV
jgi:hypothetical protein